MCDYDKELEEHGKRNEKYLDKFEEYLKEKNLVIRQ